MAATDVSITNRSLLSIGARAQVSSINPSDGSTEGDAAATLFVPTFEALARSANWNCLRQQITLSLLAAAQGTPENPQGTSLPIPPTPWLYQYAYPSDCLKIRYIQCSLPVPVGGSVPNTTFNNAAPINIPTQSQIPFVVAYSTDSANNPITVVLTNQSQAQAVYTVNQPNPVIWDSLFQEGMVSSLAAYFVPALSLNLPLMQASVQRAERIIAQARTADGNEGVTSMDHYPDWMIARGGPGRLSNYNNNQAYAYDAMCWPGGY